jgi:intron-binding protein aquarius
VRTRAVGHLRDVRRLVVATSRARLGLYVFARASLFANCFELTPTFRSLLQRPTDLRLLPEETYRTERLSTQEPDADAALVINDMPQMATFVYDLYRKKVEAIAKDPNVSFILKLFLSLDGINAYFSIKILIFCAPFLFFIIYLSGGKTL